MLKNLFSRYKPKYVRSLVYMLQSVEYDAGNYFRWYHSTVNFSSVEKRKSLVKTSKAQLLLISGWVILIALYLGTIFLFFRADNIFEHIAAVLIFVAAPYILAYIILVPLWLINLAQWPTEYLIITRATKKLEQHPGLKIAIAGSYGKTTMREILKTVLGQGKKVAAPPHTYNTLLGISQFIQALTGNEEVLIFELGENYPGDIIKLCRLVKPQIGIITGVNEAHLEKFGSLEQTAKTIFELAEWLGDKPLYINGESIAAKNHALPHHILYSRDGVRDWKTKNLQTGLDGTKFVLFNQAQELNLETKLLGLHQVGPLAIAADIALRLNFSFQEIEKGIAEIEPFEHRLQLKFNNGVYTLDDAYNGNPDGVKVIIELLSGLQGHRRFYVTPGLVEMGHAAARVHQNIGSQLAKAGIEKVVLIRNSVTPFIEQGLKLGQYSGEIIWFDEALQAYAALSSMTIDGDVVVLQNDWPDQYA